MNGTDASFVTEFVRTLDRSARLILMLHYAEGLKNSEIALILDLTESSVNDRLESIRAQTTEAIGSRVSLTDSTTTTTNTSSAGNAAR